MNIEEEIKEMQEFVDMYESRADREDFAIIKNFIKKQQAELEKKDKVIDEILNKFIEGIGYYYSEFDYMSKEEIKEYFYKKVSDNK